MRRVVITGMGAVSSIGTGLAAIERSLRSGTSGLRYLDEWRRLGLASHVGGVPEESPPSPLLNRRLEKSGSSVAKLAIAAASEALVTAQIEQDGLRGKPVAVLVGTGSGSTLRSHLSTVSLIESGTVKKVFPYTVQQVMGSTASAHVAVALGTTGESWTVASACSTGSHAIGIGALYIRLGRYQQVVAGAAEELDWTRCTAFDAMHALSRGFNAEPTRASRPFDVDRDGFVISGGAGVLLLEELSHALGRGAPIYAELIGWGSNSDGHDMVVPRAEGARGAIQLALKDAELLPAQIAYVNAHATSTPPGDVSEAQAMGEVFGARQPLISSTKSTTGHAIGAAGSLEAIYTVLMMRGGFIAPSVNIDRLDPRCAHLNLVTEAGREAEIPVALSNSFGFGGTNSCLVLRRWDGA